MRLISSFFCCIFLLFWGKQSLECFRILWRKQISQFPLVDLNLFSSNSHLKWVTQRKGGVIKQTAIWTTTSQSPCHITLSHTLHSALHSVQRWNLATGETFGQWMGYENAGVGRLARDKARFGRSTHTTNLPTLLLKLSQLTCWWTLDGARLTSAYFHLTHLTPLTHSAQILMLTLLQFGCWPRHLETLQNN